LLGNGVLACLICKVEVLFFQNPDIPELERVPVPLQLKHKKNNYKEEKRCELQIEGREKNTQGKCP
jgi:hypothetical protein